MMERQESASSTNDDLAHAIFSHSPSQGASTRMEAASPSRLLRIWSAEPDEQLQERLTATKFILQRLQEDLQYFKGKVQEANHVAIRLRSQLTRSLGVPTVPALHRKRLPTDVTLDDAALQMVADMLRQRQKEQTDASTASVSESEV